jgi:WD40 repeat protein
MMTEKVTYDDHVLPIFRNTCLNCHNPDKKKAGLDLSTYQGALQGSENGKVLESGNAAASLLFKCIKQIEEPKMPPKGDKLSDAELAVIEKWITGQLLESATGKAIAASKNNVQTAVVSLERPEGPPPMPGELPLEPFVRTRNTNALIALAASPWAPLVAVGGQKQIVLYHLETLEPLGVLPFPEGFPAIIRFSRNGQLLLTGGGLGGKSGKVVLWDIKTGERSATLGNEFDQVLAADLSADQQFVALGGPNKLVKIYATKDGKLVTSIKKHTDWVTAIAYSPDGKYLASADRNGGIQVWEASTGKEFNALPGHKVMVTGLAFMTGVLASSSEDGKVALWDVKEGKEIRSWAAHPGGAAWVDFTPDGRLVSCGRDKLAKAWDQMGKQLGATKPFNDIALRAALSGDRVVAGDWTGQIRVCSLDGKELGELTANPPSLADRLVAASKRLADAQAALPNLQQQFAAAEQKLNAEKATAEEKIKAEAAALAAAQALPADLEKRLADANAQSAEISKQRDAAAEADRPALQQKLEAQKILIAATQAELDKAKADLKGKLAAIEAAKLPPPPAPNPKIAELTKQLAQQTAEQAKLRELRAAQKDGTAEFAAAQSKLQAKKAEVAQTQASLEAAKTSPAVAAPKVSPAEEEYAKAKTALDAVNVQVAGAQSELGKWKQAQLFQTVHNARRSFADKQAQYDGLVQAAKEALGPVDRVRNDIAAAEKAAAAAPARLAEKEALFAKAQQAAEPINKAVGAAEAALAEREKVFKELIAAGAQSANNADDLAKKLAQQNSELVQLREARAAKAEGSPERAQADEKVQAKKAEVAQTQAAFDQAKAAPKPNETPEVKAALAEVAQAKQALENARSEAKAATEKADAAQKELAQAKAAADQSRKQLVSLKASEAEIVRKAQAAKIQAERDAAAAEKELAGLKAQADKLRTDYEQAKSGSAKPVALRGGAS